VPEVPEVPLEPVEAPWPVDPAVPEVLLTLDPPVPPAVPVLLDVALPGEQPQSPCDNRRPADTMTRLMSHLLLEMIEEPGGYFERAAGGPGRGYHPRRSNFTSVQDLPMRLYRLLPFLLLVPGVALADIPPQNSGGCRGLSAGAGCKTDAGGAGKCVEHTFSRPDYSSGMPPTKSRQVTSLICEESAPAAQRTEVPGGALAALGAAGLLSVGLSQWLRQRRPAQLA
jgi:hypothetical protein